MEVSSLFFFFFFIIFVDARCLDHQKKLLLDLKSELVFNSSRSQNLETWNQTYDCCKWGGVECDGAGRVVSLFLDSERISRGFGESSTLFQLTYLSELSLRWNDFTTSGIPNQFHRLTNLRRLELSGSGFVGLIPSTLSNLTNLVYLDLSENSLTGSLPSFRLCSKLEKIDISDNYLMGSLSHLDFGNLTNLSYLVLDQDSLNDSIPHHLFLLPSLRTLSLAYNQFSGQIEEFPVVNDLLVLDLSNNRINGPLPSSFFRFQNMSFLSLSDNLFDGVLQLQKIQILSKLVVLDLSYNNLSINATNLSSNFDGFPQFVMLHLASCNMYEFPYLGDQFSLSNLDLSNNHIGGDIPSWIWETGKSYLNLSFNLLTGLEKPRFVAYVGYLDLQSNKLRSALLSSILASPNFSDSVILLANNQLTGVIPTSICNCNAFSLSVLDLSFNNLSGSIPPCLIKKDLVREVLNLRGNKISGVIPDRFSSDCGLQTFDISNNNLGGRVPMSLGNCKNLLVMNVADNNIEGSFPCMLPLSLRVLLLRSNKFHGDLRCRKSWPDLQIMDISSNNFIGPMNLLNFSSFRGMMLESPTHLRLNRSNSNFLGADNYYHNEVTLTVKGIEVKLVKIWPDFTCIDLSSNYFQGDIPYAIGNLSSLYLLNLSHNAFTGGIPNSLGALTELGSLDLSENKLTGRIPWELTKLTFLSILNVSYNDLTGMIPTGRQFQTFSADMFEGNTGLCGFPLDRSCSSPPHGPDVYSTPPEPKDEEIEWEYVFAAFGYVVGSGSIAWTLLCCRSVRERYFEKIEEVVDKIFYERGRRRRHERRISRRTDKRSGVN
ncbi:receptor-like protein 32 [Salvia divinorum]|uniref:Receptor-like protein 32 n=1 Tax=Salvia divinorum TaxID=28513 RepID=A0ABD1GE19_SALDI